MDKKIEKELSRLLEIEAQLGDPAALSDQKRYRELTQEHARLSEIKVLVEEGRLLAKQLKDNQALAAYEQDEEFKAVLEEDSLQLKSKMEASDQRLAELLVPPDPRDNKNVILEVRAGTGGDEAALFVGDCVRMYKMYADKMGWSWEHLSSTPSPIGGFKEYMMVVSGAGVYRYLRYEGGTHRVQRVPETEAQGRVHTSAITVAVLLEPDETSDVVVDERDLRVDTYRSSGAGGQHVNTTDSAVRLTHLPTGIVVYCQEERSQHKNKDKAMRLLKARIAEAEEEKRMKEIADTRSQQVGSGDRSERIRTYNFPQNRVTDHRINLTKYNLDHVMDGDLEDFTKGLVAHYYKQSVGE
ncbi:MAG: peptide chain release factor 1 [Parachlamydiaceae bacterium]